MHKVTIIPRGMALGITWSLPEDDRHNRTKEELLAMITRAMGGRLAEEIKFGDVTTGASNDFEQATELARRMVTQYGMSELGPIQYGRGAHQVFLGRDISEERNYSEEVASKIDGEVRKIIETCYGDGKRILSENWDKVERMVASLLEYETVEAEEVRAILEGRPFDRSPGAQSAGRSARRSGRSPKSPKRAEKPSRLPPNIIAGTGVTIASGVLSLAMLRASLRLRSSVPAAAAIAQQLGALPRGGSYVLYPDPTIGTAAIGLWFRAPGAGYDNATPGHLESWRRRPPRSRRSRAANRSTHSCTPSAASSTSKSIPTSSESGHRSRIGGAARRRGDDGRVFRALGRRYGGKDGARERRCAWRSAALRVRYDPSRPALRAAFRERSGALSAAAHHRCRSLPASPRTR